MSESSESVSSKSESSATGIDILVTGGSGFIGSNLVRRLLHDGHDVSLLLREDSRTWRMTDIEAHVDIQRGDLRDEEFVSTAVRRINPEVVFHCAAYGAYSSETDMQKIQQVNVGGLKNLLGATALTDCKRLINIGSCFEYGERPVSHREDEATIPFGPYGESRLEGTRLCEDVSQCGELNAITLRLFSTYGPYQDPRRQMSQLCLAREKDRWPAIRPPFVARDYTYIDDVIDALMLAASSPNVQSGAIYNVGNGKPHSVGYLVRQVSKVLEIPAPDIKGAFDPTDSTWTANSSLIRNELGWDPQVDLDTGLRATVDWMETNAGLYLPNK